jgi:hypothetical protein
LSRCSVRSESSRLVESFRDSWVVVVISKLSAAGVGAGVVAGGGDLDLSRGIDEEEAGAGVVD